jgi:outer membrane murein-binding lipoprotein Lpp
MSRTIRDFSLLCVASSALLLAGCNSNAPAPQVSAPPASSAPVGVTPSSFRMPEGSGCSGDVARWKAIQDNDLVTGHVSKSVYDRIQNDINQASAACAAGRDAEARAMVRASRARNGYPG